MNPACWFLPSNYRACPPTQGFYFLQKRVFFQQIIHKNPIKSEGIWILSLNFLSLMCFSCRVNPGKSVIARANHSMGLILLVMSLYCLWCSSQIYWRNPPQPAVGEEADLGVIIFLTIYFFLPHTLCVLSMNQKEHLESTPHLPLWSSECGKLLS